MKAKTDNCVTNVSENFTFNSLICFIVGLLLISFTYFSPAMAYRGNCAKDPDQIISTLKERLELTEDQAAQIRPIIENKIKKQQELFETFKLQGREGRRALRNEMQAINKDTETQFEKILTTEQMEGYRNFQSEQGQKMRNRGSGRFK